MDIRRRDRLTLPRWAPWLVLLPIAFLTIGDQLSANFGWRETIADVAAVPPSPRLEAMGRAKMLAAMLPFMLASTLIAFYFAYEFLRLLGPRMRRQLLTTIILFVFASMFFLGYQVVHTSPAEGNMLGRGFLNAAFARVPSTGIAMDWAVRLTGEPVPMVAVLHVLVFVFSVFLIIGAGSAIAGTISCLGRPAGRRRHRLRRRCHDLQRARLDRYLYASAFLLVTGLFFMDAAFRWAAPFAADRELYMQHMDALMLFNGIYYSVILASYYLPAAALMGRFGAPSRAAAAGDGPGAVDATVADRLSPSRMIKAMMALLAPAVAGILTQLMEGASL